MGSRLPVRPWELRTAGSFQAEICWREADVPADPDISAMIADAQASLQSGGDPP